MVRPVVSGVIAFGAFKGGVSKVYHADVDSGVRRGAVCFLEVPLEVIIQRGRALLVLQSVVNDEKGAGVEAVGGLPLQNCLQASEFGEDRLKEVLAQLYAVVEILVEGVAEALDGKTTSIVFIPA